MNKTSKKRGVTLKPRSDARVIASGTDGNFRAYKVPNQSLSALILRKTASTVAALLKPEAQIRVGNSVTRVRKPFDLK